MSDTIKTNALPVTVALATYVNDTTDADNYSRAQVVSLIEDVDVIDVLAAQALLIGALSGMLAALGEIDSVEVYLQSLGSTAYEMAHHEG